MRYAKHAGGRNPPSSGDLFRPLVIAPANQIESSETLFQLLKRQTGLSVGLILLAAMCGYACADAPKADAEEDYLRPGDYIPPYTQLTEDGPAEMWDVAEVSEFKLVDQDGNEVTKESLLGKPWVANFVFTRCTVQCPANCTIIRKLNDSLAKVDVRFVTITVDPENDSVEVMREYASIWKAQPDRWKFCTGDVDAVWDLIRKGFKVTAWEEVGTRRRPGMEFAHSNHLVHVDATGKILGRYNATNEDEITVLRTVLQGKIETPQKFQPANLALLEKEAAERKEHAAHVREAADVPEAERPATLKDLPGWAKRLPATNALLNALSTILLLAGFGAIKAGNRNLHKYLMLTAFGVSVAFLACYLTYHSALSAYTDSHGKPFEGTGFIRPVYFSILISHVLLAVVVPVGAIGTIWHGLRENWSSHRWWGKITFPIWLYVSVTGVIIYLMLYRL
ncbi:MAG: DUF420 domain-containing protein [Planctomycetaceae bacterium]|nr:DUF420 domain-containing protein [Planctomycetaceae bacterium]